MPALKERDCKCGAKVSGYFYGRNGEYTVIIISVKNVKISGSNEVPFSCSFCKGSKSSHAKPRINGRKSKKIVKTDAT